MFLALLLLAGCEPEGKVIEEKNRFGGKTIAHEQDHRSRLKLRTTYYDDQGVERFEERIPLRDAAHNLGFERQEVTWYPNGKIKEDLRFAAEDLPNNRHYTRYLRRFDKSGKITYAEVDFKKAYAAKAGYAAVQVEYDDDDDPARVHYLDAAGKVLGTKEVTPAEQPTK